jgi:hypothetical protein
MICRRCERAWTATYEVIAYHDLDGDRELYKLHGAPAAPPWSGVSCPYCGGQRVKVLPRRNAYGHEAEQPTTPHP